MSPKATTFRRFESERKKNPRFLQMKLFFFRLLVGEFFVKTERTIFLSKKSLFEHLFQTIANTLQRNGITELFV